MAFQTDYRLMQVNRLAVCSEREREHSVIFSTFIKLSFVFKTFVLSIFERPLKTGLLYLPAYSCSN